MRNDHILRFHGGNAAVVTYTQSAQRRLKMLYRKKKLHDSWVFRRGDIYLANLNPFQGSEQGGTRPVLVLQNKSDCCRFPADESISLLKSSHFSIFLCFLYSTANTLSSVLHFKSPPSVSAKGGLNQKTVPYLVTSSESTSPVCASIV